MDRIRQVYLSFSRHERQLLRTYFEAFSQRGDDKALKFLTYLEERPTIEQADLAELIYGNPKAKALTDLKKKIWQRMKEVTQLSVNRDHRKIAQVDPASQVQLELLHDLAHALNLRMRGLNSLARELLQEIQAQAAAHGYPGLQLQALAMLRSLALTVEEVTEHYNPLMALTLEGYVSDLVSQAAMDQYGVAIRLERMTDEHELCAWLEETCVDLENRLNEHYSVRAYMHLLILQESLYRMQGKFDLAEELIGELRSHLDAHPQLNTKYREGLPFLHLAAIELRAYRFAQARETAHQALTRFRPGKRIYYRAILLEALSLIYLGAWDEASLMFNDLGEVPETTDIGAMALVIEFVQLCICYLQDDLKVVQRALQRDNPLTHDKRGWNVGLRLMEIMVLIDREEYDAASSRVETFRKYLERYEVISARSLAIFQYLYQLDRHSYDFQAVRDRAQILRAELEIAPEWNPVGYEIIRFESWLRAHEADRPVPEVWREDMQALMQQGGAKEEELPGR